MKLTQAAQFDGPLNKQIEDVAVDSWSRDFDYANYVLMADLASVTALSQAEYKALCDKWETNMAKDFHQDAISAAINHAMFMGIGAFSVHVDENDQILVEHWDSNILFQQRNHTN